eukprot:14999754-Alexandrium_andersonii.AAC.1
MRLSSDGSLRRALLSRSAQAVKPDTVELGFWHSFNIWLGTSFMLKLVQNDSSGGHSPLTTPWCTCYGRCTLWRDRKGSS